MKNVKIIALVALMMFLFHGRVSALSTESKNITDSYSYNTNTLGNFFKEHGKPDEDAETSKNVMFSYNTKRSVIPTKANTVEEFLQEQGLDLSTNDYIVNLDLDQELSSDEINEITVNKKFDVTIVLKDREEKVKASIDDTPETIIEEILRTTGIKYVYKDDSENKPIFKDQSLRLYKEETKQVQEVEDIDFKTETVNSDELFEGEEKITQEGTVGKKEKVYNVTYLDDEEESRELVSENITVEPVNQIKEVGTKKKEVIQEKEIDNTDSSNIDSNDDISNCKNVLSMLATAYSSQQSGLNNTTATGHTAQKGIIAVDPSIIPLGTKVYVEGYGYATASDTGKNIKGNKIDLCYDTISEANRFGRQTVKVYILKNK